LDAMQNPILQLPAPGTQAEWPLAGPAGRLETLVSVPNTDTYTGIAVICHPHPLYGGAMTNKVVWTLTASALKAGLVVARFNFRGVGKSEGVFDNAMGETEDALAVVAALRQQQPTAPLLLAGFSFGAYVSLKAAAQARPAAVVSIAPPFGRYVDSTERPAQPQCPWLAVHSADDDVVAYEETKAVLDAYAPPPEFVHFDTAGHFFHGQLEALQQAVLPFLARHFPRPASV
jgi:uncharacterized protein